MNFKYENNKNVIAKKDLEVFEENKGVVIVPEGSKGVIKSLGWSKSNDYNNCYDIRFIKEDSEIDVIIHEEEMESFLDIL